MKELDIYPKVTNVKSIVLIKYKEQMISLSDQICGLRVKSGHRESPKFQCIGGFMFSIKGRFGYGGSEDRSIVFQMVDRFQTMAFRHKSISSKKNSRREGGP